MNLLDPEELRQLLPAETHSYPSPIPTQSVSSDEFMPEPQTMAQRRVEARMKELGGALARQQGLTRRRFFQSAAGMAAAFVAMNERLYKYEKRSALATDRVAVAKAAYEHEGAARSNLRYGYVARARA